MSGHLSSIRRMFPGGNTSLGFFSFYDQIIKADAARVFLLKGGPGVGKSTFMRQIGETMLQEGYDLEYHHCSSDPSSLDALVIPKLQTAIIDGTAPHVVDPKNPGVVEEILNLGDFWNESGLKKDKDQIIQVNKKIKDCFNRAYTYLRIAGEIHKDLISLNQKAVRLEILYKLAAEIRGKIFGENSLTTHTFSTDHRKLFASAITPNGLVNYLETIFKAGNGEDERIFILEGPPGCGKELILRNLLMATIEKGYGTETFYCPLHPEKPEHLYLPQLKTGVISSHYPHKYAGNKGAEVINLAPLLLPGDELAKEAMREDELVYDDLLEKAISWLKRAKNLHDKLEAFYIPHMDFADLEELRKKTVARILS